MAIDFLIENIRNKRNPTALGLDTMLSYLPEGMVPATGGLEAAAEAIFAYNRAIIDATADIIPCAKVQVAYYEMYGVPGMRCFYDTIKYAKESGMCVIADVKRNDIGSTAEAYAKAYLGETDAPGGAERAFLPDMITVNPYLGSDGVVPFMEQCGKDRGGIFVLVKTSNASSGELQDLMVEGSPVYEHIGRRVAEWGMPYIGENGYSEIGAVVGATYPEQGALLRGLLPTVFFLVPGYGAQGATAKDIARMFDDKGCGAVVNASRSLICAHKNARYAGLNFDEAARKAALDMMQDLLEHINL